MCCAKGSCFTPITIIIESTLSCYVDVIGHSFDVFVGERPSVPPSNSSNVTYDNISTSLTLASTVLMSPGSQHVSFSSVALKSSVSYFACEFQKVLYDLVFTPNPQCIIAVPTIQSPQTFQLSIRDNLTGRTVLDFFILVVPRPDIVSVSPQILYPGSIITVSGAYFLPLSAVCIFADRFRKERSPATDVAANNHKCKFPDNLMSSTVVAVVNTTSSGSVCKIEPRVGLVSYSNQFKVYLNVDLDLVYAKSAGSVQKLERKSNSDGSFSNALVVRSDVLGENVVNIYNRNDILLCSLACYLHVAIVISSISPLISTSPSFQASIFGGPFYNDWNYFCVVDKSYVQNVGTSIEHQHNYNRFETASSCQNNELRCSSGPFYSCIWRATVIAVGQQS
jgi:hypothetical protein